MQLTLPFTIAIYMVRNFESGEHISEQRVSRLTGLLTAVYSSSQIITAVPWGFASDWLGRRPVIIFGNVVCTFSVVAFGASGNYGQAAAARFCGGFFNGITGALKTIVGELFAGNSNGQARAMSALSCAWGVGTVFGSALGGTLGDPCHVYGERFPQCGPDGLFTARPFLLPCAAVGLLSLFSIFISIWVLEETLPSAARRGGGDYQQVETGDSKPYECQLATSPGYRDRVSVPVSVSIDQPPELELSPILWQPGSGVSASASGCGDKRQHHDTQSLHHSSGGVQQEGSLSWSIKVAAGGSIGATETRHSHEGQPAEQQQHQQQQQMQQQQRQLHLQQQQKQQQPQHQRLQLPNQCSAASEEEWQPQHRPSGESSCHFSVGRRRTGSGHDPSRSSMDQGNENNGSTPSDKFLKQRDWSPRSSSGVDGVVAAQQLEIPWYRRTEVQLSVGGYGALAFFNTLVNELVPLFAATSVPAGGMALEASQLAGPLAFSGATFLLYAGLIYPAVQQHFGIMSLCVFGLVLAAPVIAVIPLASLSAAAGRHIQGQAILYVSLAIRSVAMMNAMTSAIVFVNQAAPVGKLGAVNGAAQMVASAVRGAAPALCGVVWAATLGLQVSGRQFIPFALCASAYIVIATAYHYNRRLLTAMAPSS